MLKKNHLWQVLTLSAALVLGSAITAYASENTEQAQEASAVTAEETSDVIMAGAAALVTDEESSQQSEDSQADSQEAAETASEETADPHHGLISLGIFRTTGYCPCAKCSEGWGRRTSTGAIATSNHTIAVDPKVIPYGSQIMINGVIYTAEDRGGGVRGNHIDIFYDTHSQTRQHGTRQQEVFLVS